MLRSQECSGSVDIPQIWCLYPAAITDKPLISAQGAHLKNEPEEVVKVWLALLELIERGQIRPVLHPKIYDGLDKLQEGLTDLATRKILAKAILRISPEAGGKSKL